MGGRLVLPEASCPVCSEKTSKVELTCLRTMYGPLRMLYGLPSRRRDKRPETLPLKMRKTKTSPWEEVPISQDRFPFLITFPIFDPPGLLTGRDEADALGAKTQKLWVRGASPYHDFFALLESLSRELKAEVMPVSTADTPAFCSMLGKIALSAIVACGGRGTHRSRLARIALGEQMENCRHYIGSTDRDEPTSRLLHELSVGRASRTDAVVVRIRLLSKLGTPTYFVVAPRADVGATRDAALPDPKRTSG